MTLPLFLIVAHFIGDFVCQTDWMATNKSKRLDALAFHCVVYAAVIAGVVNWRFFLSPASLLGFPVAFGVWFAVTFVTHFATDAVTSRITSRLWFFKREDGIWTQAEYTQPKHGRTIINPWSPIDGKRHWFFVVIGADQVIHYATLAATWIWLV